LKEGLLDPRQLGLPPADKAALLGGDASFNASIIRDEVLAGKRGPRRDIAVLNAAAALVLCGAAPGLEEGLAAAENSIDTGEALRKLEDMVSFSRKGG